MKKTALIGIAILMAANLATAASSDKEQTPAQKKIQQQLSQTILPNCDFREANLADIMDFLKATTKGLNIVIGFPVTKEIPAITLSLRNIPVGDVIRYVTQIAGLDYKIDDNAVIITRTASSNYRTETIIAPATEPDQYMIDFKIYSTDAAGKEDVLSSPRIVVKTGQEGEIKVADTETNGIFAKVIINEKNGGIEAITRITIKSSGKDTFNSAQTISLKKK